MTAGTVPCSFTRDRFTPARYQRPQVAGDDDQHAASGSGRRWIAGNGHGASVRGIYSLVGTEAGRRRTESPPFPNAMSAPLHISRIDHPAGLVVRLRGSLDATSTPEFDALINECLNASPPGIPSAHNPGGLFVFDLSEVDMMGSLAMGALIRLHRGLLIKHGTLRLATVPPAIMGAMKHARLHLFFEIYDTVENALGEVVT